MLSVKPTRSCFALRSVMIFLLAAVLPLQQGISSETTEEWVASMESRMESVETKLKEWKAEIQGKDVEAARLEAMNEARELREDISNQLDDLKQASGDKAEELKQAIESKYEQLREKLKDKTS